MAKFGNQVKLAWLKGMEAIGKGASSLASNAHLKVTEINLESRRREILSEFPLRAHDLWQKGVTLPEPLGDMMAELNELDEKLSVLRAQRYARVEAADSGDEKPAEEEAASPADNAEENVEASADVDTNDEAAAENASEGAADEATACDTAQAACDNDKPCDAEPSPTASAEDGAKANNQEQQGEGDNA